MRTPNTTPWWGKHSTHTPLPPGSVRKYDIRALTVGILLIGLIVSTLTWSLIGLDFSKPFKSQAGSVEYPSSIDSVLTGCGSYFTFTPTTDQYGVFDSPEVLKELGDPMIVDVPVHRAIVPAFGYMTGHENNFETRKVYAAKDAPTRSEVLRAMYSGTQVIWFDRKINTTQRDELVSYIKGLDSSYDNVVAIEWTDERSIPRDRSYAFSAWGVTQSCAHFSPDIFDEYRAFVQDHPELAPPTKEPPNAKVGSDGKISPIHDPTR